MLKTILGLTAAMMAVSPAWGGAPSADLHIPGPRGDLAGTLVAPADSRAAVLIIPGSGPTDRNGDNPLGVHARPYALLADALAREHVTTLRIDKRGLFASRQAIADPNAVTIDDYVDDTLAWARTLRERTGARCVWLLGHSEGGLIALAAAARHPDALCGVVLVATAGRPLAETIKTQLRANPANAPLLAAADHALDALAAGRRVDEADLPAPLLALFHPSVQGFLISVFAQDPAQLIARIDKPILIVQGARDLQVGVDDAQALQRAQPSAVLATFADVNHVLKTVRTDERAANLATYADPDLPLAPGLVDAIARFVTSPAR
jgi:uncharacterized protein